MLYSREDIEEIILGMADIVKENRYLRERVEMLRLKVGSYEAKLYGMSELAEKLDKRLTENLAYYSIRAIGGLSSDKKIFIDDMDNLTIEEYKFLERI